MLYSLSNTPIIGTINFASNVILLLLLLSHERNKYVDTEDERNMRNGKYGVCDDKYNIIIIMVDMIGVSRLFFVIKMSKSRSTMII